jgi:hypothetical protein
MPSRLHLTAAYEETLLALYLHAEDDLQACIANFFTEDPDRMPKMAAARARCDTSRDDWVICRQLRHLKPTKPDQSGKAPA